MEKQRKNMQDQTFCIDAHLKRYSRLFSLYDCIFTIEKRVQLLLQAMLHADFQFLRTSRTLYRAS